MSSRLNHQRLNNQKRTIKRGADSREALSDEAFEALEIMKTLPTPLLNEALNATWKSIQLLEIDLTSKADQRARDYLFEISKGINKIINSR